MQSEHLALRNYGTEMIANRSRMCTHIKNKLDERVP